MTRPFSVAVADRWWYSLPIFAAIGLAVLGHPLGRPWLALGLLAYTVLIWRYPLAWIVALPALLPLLDVTRWTGRFFLDEFDLVVLVTLGVGLCRPAANPGRIGLPLPFAAVASLVALSYLVSAGIGLLPLQPWDANAFSNYHSHYNALRVAKGALWAFSLLWLAAISMRPGADMRKLFTLGMVAGLAGTVAVIFWERVAFTGLFNFSHDYRVSGPFSALHIGGSTLETYLVAALPFALFAVVATRNAALRLGGLLLFGGGVYGVMVAYSRAGFAALVAVAALMFVAFVRHGLRHKLDRKVYVLVSLFVIGASVVAVPVLKGSFAQGRLAQSERDLQTRLSYWRNALAMMDDGWRTSLFGMGLGRFPETFFWRSTVGTRPGTYRFESENGNTFLRLGSGSPIFVDQIVALQPHSQYTLSVDVRRRGGVQGGEFEAPVCEAWVRGARSCERVQFPLRDAIGEWQHYEIAFNSNELGAHPWFARGPTRLNLRNPAAHETLDIDNVRLLGEDGRDHLVNGGFDDGGDRWWPTVDDNWPWHVENFWLHIYFEQGWLGLLGMAALAAGALWAAFRRTWRGDLFAGALTASMAGFLVVGTLNSPNDDPRLLLLFLLLCGLALGKRESVNAPDTGPLLKGAIAGSRPLATGPLRTLTRFDELDSLRAIAAIAVVLVHYRIHFDVHPLPGPVNFLADGGDFAVDFFFVLSGFVLCRKYWSEGRRLRVFANLWERVARLYPLQVLTLLLVAWGQWFLVSRLATQPFRYELNDSYHFSLNLALLNASGLEKGFSFNAPSWSVSTEFIVNALFLLLIALPRRLVVPLVVALAATAFALLLGAGEILVNNRVPLAEVPHIGTIEAALVRTSLGFFVGALLWMAVAPKAGSGNLRGARWFDVIFLFTGLCIAALFGSYRIRHAIPHWDFVLVLLLFPLLVVSATLSRTARAALRWTPLLLLGHASYSIYLIHFPPAARSSHFQQRHRNRAAL